MIFCNLFDMKDIHTIQAFLSCPQLSLLMNDQLLVSYLVFQFLCIFRPIHVYIFSFLF